MHSFTASTTTFNYNSDLSGRVKIRDKQTSQEIEVYGRDLIEFVAEYVRSRKISRLERQSANHVLGIE